MAALLVEALAGLLLSSPAPETRTGFRETNCSDTTGPHDPAAIASVRVPAGKPDRKAPGRPGWSSLVSSSSPSTPARCWLSRGPPFPLPVRPNSVTWPVPAVRGGVSSAVLRRPAGNGPPGQTTVLPRPSRPPTAASRNTTPAVHPP